MTKPEHQDTSGAAAPAFSRGRRVAAVVAFSFGLGSLAYGTLLSLPAAAESTTPTAPPANCSTASASPSGTGTTGTGTPSTTGTATATATDGSGDGATASAGDTPTDQASDPGDGATASASGTDTASPSAGPTDPCTTVGASASATGTASGVAQSPTPTASATSKPTSTVSKSLAPTASKTPSTPAKGGPPATRKTTPTGGAPESGVAVYVVAPTGSYFVYAQVPPGNASVQLPHGTITRAEIMARAQLWVQAQVPYSQTEWYTNADGTYRQDCSGYVSMAWDLDQNTDFWTGNLNLVSHTIPASQLLPGDILLSDEHTILFAGWADTAHTTFDYYEEAHPGTVARFVVDAPLSAFLSNGFAPFRYDGVVDSAELPANPADGELYSMLAQQGSEVDPPGVATGQPAGLAPSSDAPSSTKAASRIAAQAAADDVAGGQNGGVALGMGGAFLVGAGVLMRRPVLQARRRRH